MSSHQAASPEGLEERFDRERTRGLFAAFGHEKDPRVRDELVVAHLNLVRYLAVRFANRGEALDDLIQVGTVGLIKAIDRFDTGRGVEFTTYATPTIIGEIKRYFRDKGWAVRVPRRLQELNLAVNRAVENVSVELGRAATVSDLAERLNATDEEIIEAQELGQAYNLLSLDSELSVDGDAKSTTLLDYLGREDSELNLLEDKANLARGFELLDRRERIILYLRFYENMSQTEVARRLNVSQMHVSRLQQRALEKLKKFLKEE
ncbi:MAG: B/F/G family RNA polymerase sigma-70 factor [Candidatus Eremiobacter antarcticus]|nr:SigB/SigF/SigG family RNA polymerase sigma factor [Candidatus Eremiobacteraeota bacterium]MBC5808270.1 SigB/SigF/SigG family RNA polymerase sigma factor [Candidatus Eremiobacteraeota bacterium]PZR63652.1 MAG: B/F/G family RNA polymerase sigma-70 factor [Candidatus Eremiobacter sp. RRmetagenome_bin22]